MAARSRLVASWWGRLALRPKMVLVAGIPLVALAVAVPSLILTGRAASEVGDTIQDVYEVRQSLGVLLQDLVDADASARSHLLTHDTRFLQPYRVAAGSATGDFVRLRQRLEEDASATTRLDLLGELVDMKLSTLRRLVAFADATPMGSLPETLMAQGGRTMDQIRQIIGELDASQGRLLEVTRQDLRRARSLSMLVSVVVVPLALLATIAVVLAFANGLVKRVKRIEQNARRLETGEPLDAPEPGVDELARLDSTLMQTAVRLAAQDAELRELALVDPLTGFHNRRGFLEIAEHELQVCQRRGSGTALLFVDVDGLKLVNDRHGHSEGDRLLREVADVLRSAVRESDLLARIGGDEFCILLSRDSAVDGSALLERLRGKLEARNERGDLPYEIAFSAGMGFFDPAAPVSVEDLIVRADRAMYDHKRRRAPVSL